MAKNTKDCTLGLGELEIAFARGKAFKYQSAGFIKHSVQLLEMPDAQGINRIYLVVDLAEFNEKLIARLTGGVKSKDALFLDGTAVSVDGRLTAKISAVKKPVIYDIGGRARKAFAVRFTHARLDSARLIIEAANAFAEVSLLFHETDWSMIRVVFELRPDEQGRTHRIWFEKRARKGAKIKSVPKVFEAGRPLVTLMAPKKARRR